MQKPPIDPDVDTAPSDSVLTVYDDTSSRICACSTRMRKVPTGGKSRGCAASDLEHESDRAW
jgi:hypothetical protein